MGSLTQNIRHLATNPRVAVALASYSAQAAIGRAPSIPVHGGRIRGFRRFNDFWSVWTNRLSEAEIGLIRNRGGDHLVDVGGNFGVFSLAMAREHPSSTVHTFEPSSRVYTVLQENVRRNRITNVRTNRAAVSDSEGTLKFTVNEESEAMSRIGEGVANKHARTNTFEVQAVTLDDYCDRERIDRIGVLKIDVEGAEPKVLRGARNLLGGKRVACIYIEFCPEWLAEMNESPESLRSPLEAAGYQLHELAPNGTVGKSIDLAAAGECVNVVAVPT